MLPAKRFDTPLDFLKAVWNSEVIATDEQVEAAKAALPYKHPKLLTAKATSRETALAKATAAQSSGRFRQTQPPKLLVDNTRRPSGSEE